MRIPITQIRITLLRSYVILLVLILCSCQKPPSPAMPNTSSPPKIKYGSTGWLTLQRGEKSYVLKIWHDTKSTAQMKISVFQDKVPVVPGKPFKIKALVPVIDEWEMMPYADPDDPNASVGGPAKATFLVAMNAAVYEIPSLMIGNEEIGPIRFGFIGNPYLELATEQDKEDFLTEHAKGVPSVVQGPDSTEE